ncbi:hypothetical protein Tco_1550115, partial [Tanacetum coccineum]
PQTGLGPTISSNMIEIRADVQLKGFKPTEQVYRHVSNKNNANTSDKKKQAESAGKGANCGVSLSDHRFFHMTSSSTSTTPIVERIDKLERQIIDEKLTLVDDDGKPLPKVISTVNEHSDSEAEDVVDEHEIFMASTSLQTRDDSGYGTNILLEQ